MALTDVGIRALKPTDKPYKVTDGKGLYLQVTPAGGKLWRLKYRARGKEKLLSIGSYPEVSLNAARKARDSARELIAAGGDPATEKQRDKVRNAEAMGHSFDSVAGEFIEKRRREGMATATLAKAEWFRGLLRPIIGREPVSAVDPHMLLSALKKIESRGRLRTSSGCALLAGGVSLASAS